MTGDRLDRRVVAVPHGDGSTLFGEVAHAVISGVPGVADAPVPVDLWIHDVRHVLGITRAPAVGLHRVGMSHTGAQPETGARHDGSAEDGDECSFHAYILRPLAESAHRAIALSLLLAGGCLVARAQGQPRRYA